MVKILVIVISLFFIGNIYAQNLKKAYVDSTGEFRLNIPYGFKIKKRSGSNISEIYDKHGKSFASIYLLRLSNIYQKYDLKNENNYHELVRKWILETMNGFEIRTPESEVDNQLDSLIEYQTSNGINHFIAYHRSKTVWYNSNRNDLFFVQPYYFVELLKKSDGIILMFINSDQEFNTEKFVLNDKKQIQMLNIIDTVTLFKN